MDIGSKVAMVTCLLRNRLRHSIIQDDGLAGESIVVQNEPLTAMEEKT